MRIDIAIVPLALAVSQAAGADDVDLRIVEADGHQRAADGDPDSFSGGVEKPEDNYGSGVGITPVSSEVTFSGGDAAVEQTYTIPNGARQPGNNYLVAASSNMTAASSYYRFGDQDPDSLYYNDLQEGSGGSGGSGGAVVTQLGEALHTATLTIWRTLWMELDDMEAPDADPPDGPFGYGDGADDVQVDPGQPPIGLAETSLVAACLRVQQLPAAYDLIDNADFVHNMTAQISGNVSTAVRNVYSDVDFWVIHTIGAYEEAASNDWDPNGEASSWLGWAYQCGADKSNFIFYETIRDRQINDTDPTRDPVDQETLTQRVVLHEALHRFLGEHGGDPATGVSEGIMLYDVALYGTAEQNELTPRQLRVIQQQNRPE